MKTKLFEIQCPKCHSTYYVNAETLINGNIEKNFHDMILNKSFFNRKCSNCSHIIEMKYPFIYYDPATKIQLRYNMEIDDRNQILVENNNQLIEYIKVLDDNVNIEEIINIKKILNTKYNNNFYDGCDLENYYFIADGNNIIVKRKHFA